MILVDKQEALLCLDGDKELYIDIIKMFFEDPQFSKEELDSLLAENNIKEAEEKVHLLKGIAGTLGAKALFASSKELDDVLKGRETGDIPSLKTQMFTLFDQTYEELKKVLAELDS